MVGNLFTVYIFLSFFKQVWYQSTKNVFFMKEIAYQLIKKTSKIEFGGFEVQKVG